jgi:ABC-type transport system substrate-binding protein
MDDLVTRQASTTDQVERVRLFRDIQRVFSDHLPAMYFAAPRLFVALGPRVRNERPAVSAPQLLWSIDTLAVVSDVASRP